MPRSSSVEAKQLRIDRPRSSELDRRGSAGTGRWAAPPAAPGAFAAGVWFRLLNDPEINAATPGAVLRDAARTTCSTWIGERTIDMSPSAEPLIGTMLPDADSCLHLAFLTSPIAPYHPN